MANVSNTEDVIDSRDVIERIEELEAERQGLAETADAGDNTEAERLAARADLKAWGEENAEELSALKSLAEQASDYAADWECGETLVRGSYFETYAQELAEDCGMVQEGALWPNTCIDWEQAARELKMDYTSVDFDGVDYWIR
jgi:hypothetical protein